MDQQNGSPRGGREEVGPFYRQQGGVWREQTPSTSTSTPGQQTSRTAPQALKEIQKFATKEMGTPGVHTDTRLNKTLCPKGIQNVSYHTCAASPRKS
jgi:large subunit ribosomal protein L31e